MTDQIEPGGAAPNALRLASRDQLRAAILAERRGSWVAAAVPVFLYLAVDQKPILLAFAAATLALSALRSRALPAIDRGEIERAIAYFAAGKWLVSILLVLILPVALPIVVVNLIMPITLGSTHLPARRFVPMTVASVLVALVVGMAGYLQDFLALVDDVEPWIVHWTCIITLAVHFIPLNVILWRANQQQQITYDRAIAANSRFQESEAELRRSRGRLVDAADTERSRIERDLHDGAQQRFSSVLVQLRLQTQLARRGTPIDLANLEQIVEELDGAIDELRDLAHGIYPPLLAMGGLPAALRAVARRAGVDVGLRVDGIERLDPAVEAAVYFVCLEAVQNAVKHGGEDVRVDMELVIADERLLGRVSDDGPGFDPSGPGGGRGLDNMADRIGAAGGTLSVQSEAGRGTDVVFDLPARRLEHAGIGEAVAR